MMDRRDVLKLGAAAGAAALGGSGCSSLLPGQLPSGDSGPLPTGFLNQLDTAMDAIALGRPLHELTDPASNLSPAKAAQRAPNAPAGNDSGSQLLVKKSLRSLLLTGAYHQLPAEQRQHPEFQRRVLAAGPELDDAVFGTLDMLDGMSRGDRVELQRRLRRDPALPDRVAEALDIEAKGIGIPFESRLRLRKLAKHVNWRLEKQPLELLLDEYVGKVRKVASRHGYDEAVQRQIATRATENALLAWQPTVLATATPAAMAQPAGAPAPPYDYPSQPPYPYGGPYPLPPEQPPAPDLLRCVSEDDATRGKVTITVGSVLLGVAGALSISATTLLMSGGLTTGLFVFTAAGVLLIAGLITIIVGGAQATKRLNGPICPADL